MGAGLMRGLRRRREVMPSGPGPHSRPALCTPRTPPHLSSTQGTAGECGLRGGYVEMTNIHPGTIEEVYKCASINLSPNTVGQVALSCLVNPPKPGERHRRGAGAVPGRPCGFYYYASYCLALSERQQP